MSLNLCLCVRHIQEATLVTHTFKWFVVLSCVFVHKMVEKWWDGNERRHGQSKLKGNYCDQRCPLKGWVCCLLQLNFIHTSHREHLYLKYTQFCKWYEWCYRENLSSLCVFCLIWLWRWFFNLWDAYGFFSLLIPFKINLPEYPYTETEIIVCRVKLFE